MRDFLFVICLSIFLFSCKNNNAPNVSDIKISLTTQRLEQDLFKADTNNLRANIEEIQAKYKGFGENFFGRILNADPRWGGDTMQDYVKGFVKAYRYIYDSSQLLYKDFTPYEKQIKNGLQYVHYYFPGYKIPHFLITYIGPLDGYGDLLDDDAIVVGLHQHLGATFSAYNSTLVSETYPAYISRRFTPEYIPVNAMHNILNDLYPHQDNNQSLVEQMVEQGKLLYALQKLLPATKEDLIIGYTPQQLKDSYERENVIWQFFLQNNLLQNTDYNTIKNYIGDTPKTQELGEAAPGNIGAFSGWQIVKKFMAGHLDIKLTDLMKMSPEKIYNEAKYKP